MSLRLYIDLLSQPCRAVTLFVRANSIPCEEVLTRIGKGEHQTDAFAKINPFLKLPAIDHDGFKITESVAILQYLCRTFPVPEHWYPSKDVKKIACIESYMAWQHLNLRLNGSMVFRTKLQSYMSGKPVDEKKMSQFTAGLSSVLDQMESIWLKDRPFIATDEMSIADLLAVAELEQPRMAGYEVSSGRPKVAEYMKLVRSQLQPHYDEIHSTIYKLRSKMNDKSKEASKL